MLHELLANGPVELPWFAVVLALVLIVGVVTAHGPDQTG